MANYVLEILRNATLRQKMGASGRRRAVEQFDQHKIIPIYEKYYERILAT
ncbi:MAG TPA: hypothetical protein VJ521_14330 [Acidobacteriota bacterium]|nr:hypothetical protein [Acidobacteriota bacterium]